MLSEHETGRAFIRGIADAAARLEADPAAIQQLINNGRGYIQLLRAHIAKENSVLFPMADRVLTPEDQAGLAAAFEHFEAEETRAGVHEASIALLKDLTANAT
jgi:hemerythrin-like domain-containing protein